MEEHQPTGRPDATSLGHTTDNIVRATSQGQLAPEIKALLMESLRGGSGSGSHLPQPTPSSASPTIRENRKQCGYTPAAKSFFFQNMFPSSGATAIQSTRKYCVAMVRAASLLNLP